MIAVILAKRSVRFPGKHLQEFRGTTLIGYMVEKLRSSGIFQEVIIFTKDSSVTHQEATVLFDSTDGTAADSIVFLIKQFGEIFVLAGDMPLIDTAFISEMLDMYSGKPLFPVHSNGWLEPLHGIYCRPMLDSAQHYLESGRKSLIGLINECDHEVIRVAPSQGDFFRNVNTREDLDMLQ